MKAVFALILGINLMGFVLMGLDKFKSKLGLWRIREKTLLATALAFGSAGVYLGLIVFRHKTRHRLFTVTLPVITAIHVMTAVWLANKMGLF